MARAAAIGPTGGTDSSSADQRLGLTAGDSLISGAQKGIKIPGPDDIELLLEPYADGWTWKIRNGSLGPIDHLRFEIVGARSFDAKKRAFRQPIALRVQWNIKDIPAGQLTPEKAIILVRIEGDHLGLGNINGMHQLSWPTGDPTEVERWLLEMRIVRSSREWPIEVDLRWTVGTKRLEISQYSDGGPADDNAPAHGATDEAALKQEGMVGIFPEQEYPQYMHHASKPPVIVNSAKEQAALGQEWSETYIHQAYPKCKHGWNGETITVKDAEEESALGPGWADGAGASCGSQIPVAGRSATTPPS